MNMALAEAGTRPDLSWALVADTYVPLPFHGPEHPLTSRQTARVLTELYRRHNPEPDNKVPDPDDEVIEHTIAAHDAGIAYGLNKPKYSTKELRSAKLVRYRQFTPERYIEPDLWIPNQELWLPADKIMPVYNGIKSTQYDTPVTNIEEVIDNRTDVDNVGQSYLEDTVPNAVKLLIERRYLCLDSVSYDMFRSEVAKFLGGYAAKDLLIGDFDINKDGQLWFSAFVKNIINLLGETEDSLKEKVGEVFWGELEEAFPPTEGAKQYTAEAFEKLFEPLF